MRVFMVHENISRHIRICNVDPENEESFIQHLATRYPESIYFVADVVTDLDPVETLQKGLEEGTFSAKEIREAIRNGSNRAYSIDAVTEHTVDSSFEWDIDRNVPVYTRDLLEIAGRWVPAGSECTLREYIETMANDIGRPEGK